MKLFFGRINKEQEPQDQLDAGYYFSPKGSSYFGDLANITDFAKEPVYVYMVGGSKIQLWKAREWSQSNDRLLFDIIMPNVQGLSTLNIAAFKYFNINLDLIIFPIRQSRGKAFYTIEPDAKFTEAILLDTSQYKDENNYRKIEIQASAPKAATLNLVLYRENGLLKFNTPSLFDPEISKTFVDNTVNAGKGRKRKDNVLKQIAGVKNPPAIFDFNQLRILPLYDAYFVDYDTDVDVEEELTMELPNTSYNFMDIDLNHIPLNQIFYGPPGTGKTYHTVPMAVAIANPDYYKVYKDNWEELKKEYDRLLIDWGSKEPKGQIAFCTFHQSLSYEDFIEGIKPQEPKSENSNLSYKIEPGIFKRLCEIVDESPLPAATQTEIAISETDFTKSSFYKISLGDAQKEDDDVIYEYCTREGCISLGWGKGIDFTGKSEQEIKALGSKGTLTVTEAGFINAFIHNLKDGDYVVVSYGNLKFRAIGKVVGGYEYNQSAEIRYKHFRKVNWLIKDVKLPVDLLYNNQFIQKAIYRLDKEQIKKDYFVKTTTANLTPLTKRKRYVLVIDEINRGSISQIFGELITLIETSKRKGKTEALSVCLPYSKKTFSVPDNIYLVGTMNTADRSVEALDTALRRRFSFKEVFPDYTAIKPETIVIDGKNFNLIEILETINKRIEKLLNRDHLIGHSYFIEKKSAKDIKDAFANCIIPLMQEYFYGDYAKMCLVVGKGFVDIDEEKSKEDDKKFFADDRHDATSDFLEKKVWAIKNVAKMDESTLAGALNILLKGKTA